MHNRWIAALCASLLLGSAPTLAADDTTVAGPGGEPDAWYRLGDDHNWLFQSVTVPMGFDRLRSVSFHFLGSDLGAFYTSRFTVSYGNPFSPLFAVILNQDADGPLTLDTGDVPVVPGSQLMLTFISDVDPEWWSVCGGRPEGCVPARYSARVGVTAGDEYDGGEWASHYDGPTGRDLAFEAAFTATPEPASMALVGSGLAGLLGLARRKRRGRDGGEPDA